VLPLTVRIFSGRNKSCFVFISLLSYVQAFHLSNLLVTVYVLVGSTLLSNINCRSVAYKTVRRFHLFIFYTLRTDSMLIIACIVNLLISDVFRCSWMCTVKLTFSFMSFFTQFMHCV